MPELCAAAAFVLIHLTSPLWIGELYPFTISPMFCDCPQACCQYEVFDADGRPLDEERFNLHMVYDGNPPGLGMGIIPHPTLHEFGAIASKEQLINHVRRVLENAGDKFPDHVVIHQHCLYPRDHRIEHEKKILVVELPENDE